MYGTDCRVARGGIFHTRKVQYSPETHALLRELINESKLSIFQRKQVNESLRSGKPLPTFRGKEEEVNSPQVDQVILKPNAKKRSLNSILQAGVYERESYRPPNVAANREYEKERLQNLMAFGKVIAKQPTTVRKRALSAKLNQHKHEKSEEELKTEFFASIVKEIEDRLEFLHEMVSLGEGKRYKLMINNEIREKLAQMKALDPIKYNEFIKKHEELNPKKNVKKITTLANTIFESS